MSPESTVQKAIDRMKDAIRDGKAYEGLQTIKSLNRRLSSKKQYDCSRTLLAQSASEMWQSEETAASLDLGKLLMQNCTKHASSVDAAAPQLQSLLLVMAMSPPTADDAATLAAMQNETCSWAETAASWAWASAPTAAGTLELLRLAGDVVVAVRGFRCCGRACVLYARCNSVNKLHEVLTRNPDAKCNEWPMFTTRIVLLLLAYAPPSSPIQWPEQISQGARIKAAQFLLMQCQEEQLHAPHFESIPQDTVCLFSFCKLLLQVLELDYSQRTSAQKLWILLKAHYMPAISRDPELMQLLDMVSLVFLNIQPSRPSTGGLLGNIMAMMTS